MPPDHSRDPSGPAALGAGPDGKSGDSWFLDESPLPSAQAVAADIDLESVVDSVVDRCTELAFAGHRHDPDFRDRLRASVSQNAYALRDVIAGRVRLPDVKLDEVLTFASVQAQLRIPQKSMQRSYRISFFMQWQIWTSHLREHIVEDDLSAEVAADALTQLTQTILAYQDYVASQVAEAYTRDYEVLNRSRAHVRRNLVREILRGEHDSLTASDLALLAYALDGHHVVVLLPAMAEGAATQLADGLRSATHSSQSLLYPLAMNSTVIWLCRLEPWSAAAAQVVIGVLTDLGVTASVSNPEPGLEGFVAALSQAEDVERVRAAWGVTNAPGVIRYADAGLELLLLQNDRLARVFVDAELGPLAGDTPEAARLRETLEASFRFGSHVAAAEYLQLHEHTVRNRLQKADEILGHSLQERRTELQVAIRIVRLLDQSSGPT